MDSILIIDDNEEFVEDTVHSLKNKFNCHTAPTGEAGLESVKETDPDLILLDYDLGQGASGLEILQTLVADYKDIPIIMVTKESGVRTVVKAMKLGAFDYVVKNTSRDEFLDVIRKGMELRRVKIQNAWLRRSLQESLGSLIGESAAILRLKNEIQDAAATDLSVLITGDTGTGKTMIARMIHEASARNPFPFVDVNVSAIEKELFNSEVFGHEKGSFTGAVGAKKGLTELAHQGTLFLDEIGDMNLQAQIKLLTAIESGQIRRVGAIKDVQVDFRLIAATHQVLEDRIQDGLMRQDLFYRLNQIRVIIPPLSERTEDIPLLLRYFAHKFFPAREEIEISDAALDALCGHSWPGNVRELESAVQLALVRCQAGVLEPHHFNFGVSTRVSAQDADFSGLTEQNFAEARDLLLLQLRNAYLDRYLGKGSIKEAAEQIGISREVLHRWVKELRKD
jgi:DNA-binding NtrC family response regulator